MVVFAVLLGLALPLALVAARKVARSRASCDRDRRLLGGGWACFGGSFGVAIGALFLLAQGYRIAGFIGSVLGVWLAFAGIALAIEGTRRVRRSERANMQTFPGTFYTL